MYEYFFLKKQDPEFKYTARTQPRRNWRTEFMRSLTYELTTIYADELKQTRLQSKELGIFPVAVDQAGILNSLSKSCLERSRFRQYLDADNMKAIEADPSALIIN